MTTKVRGSVLADTAVTAGNYGGATTLQTVTVDAQGRITYAANITSGVITAGTRGQGADIIVPTIQYNALGQIVAATNTTIRTATTSVTGVVQLADSVSNTSTTAAATASAVKTAYDAAINALNASNISSGTLPAARLSGSYTGITGVGTLTVGSIPFATNASAATNATFATSATSATNATFATSATSATNASAATNATFATSATSATNATFATSATNATFATSATNASAATNATFATTAGNGGVTSVNGLTGSVSMTAYGAIGSYIIAGSTDFNTVATTYSAGTTVAGSTLTRSSGNQGGGSGAGANNVALNMWWGGGFNGYGNGTTMASSFADTNLGLSGTWRLMTFAYYSAGYGQYYPVGLFVRIS